MTVQSYYHALFRKYTVLFGSLFDSIYIDRVNVDDNPVKTMKVPLSYGPKEWYIARYEENKGLTKEISSVLPRIAFNMQAVRYAAERKMNTQNKITAGNSYKGTKSTMAAPVPYDIHIRLSVMTKNADDGTRILEQILPRFTPELTLSIVAIKEMDIRQDIAIVLLNVANDDSYIGNIRDDDRVIIWDLDFVLKGEFYGPAGRSSIIKKIDLNFFGDMNGKDFLDHVKITPGLTPNGDPTSNIDESIPYDQIIATDNYGYVTEFLGGGNPAVYEESPTSANNPILSTTSMLNGGKLAVTKQTVTAIAPLVAVKYFDSQISTPDLENDGDAELVFGIALNSSAAWGNVIVQMAGEIQYDGWSWISGEPIFCGDNGVLTQTAPTIGWVVEVATAINTNTIAIDVKQAVYLSS